MKFTGLGLVAAGLLLGGASAQAVGATNVVPAWLTYLNVTTPYTVVTSSFSCEFQPQRGVRKCVFG